MTLQELNQLTGLDKGLLSQVVSNLIKMQKIHAARGIFRARVLVEEHPRFQSWGGTMVQMINETYRTSLKDSVPTSA